MAAQAVDPCEGVGDGFESLTECVGANAERRGRGGRPEPRSVAERGGWNVHNIDNVARGRARQALPRDKSPVRD